MLLLISLAAAVLATPLPRAVTALDQAAFAEAQQRDDTAVRSFSSVPIKTSRGQCLLVDELSGDFRANLTPVQVGDCSGGNDTTGTAWDIITSGKHNDRNGNRILVVSTLTQACLNADPRRDPGSQVNLFSCGGRADGGGDVTNSQLMAVQGDPGRFRLSPDNGEGYCMVAGGETLDIAACDEGDDEQWFTLGGASQTPSASATSTGAASTSASASASASVSSTTTPVPSGTAASTAAVSRGGNLVPTAVSEAQQPDDTATRPLKDVHVRSPDGRCLSVDPTAGDFRENIIPVAVAACAADIPGQKFDIVTSGKHNDGKAGEALIVSALTNGCISFDARRPAGDTVTVFSCGGRADGGKPPRILPQPWPC